MLADSPQTMKWRPVPDRRTIGGRRLGGFNRCRLIGRLVAGWATSRARFFAVVWAEGQQRVEGGQASEAADGNCGLYSGCKCLA